MNTSGVDICIHTPAKINLFLAVESRRPDGYHDLFSLMCPVSIFDTVTLSFDRKKTTVACTHPDVPQNEENLAFKAAEIFFKALGRKHPVSIHIQKRIPVAAGLGGGSSDAAAVLSGLNQWLGHPFSIEKLTQFSSSVGADVPFFITPEPALVSGIGDKLCPFKKIPHFWVVLISFKFKVSTADVYKNLNLALTKCKKKLKSFGFRDKRFDAEKYLCNDLETVTMSRWPEIAAAKQALIDRGAAGALMSGSGPTVFGLFNEEKAARMAKSGLQQHHRDWRIFVADLLC